MSSLQPPASPIRANTEPSISTTLSAAASISANGAAGSASQFHGHASSDLAGVNRIQVINEEKNFSKELSPQLEAWGLADVGFSYDVVAVFGSQSSGKSTLLNRLFQTSFVVMDETRRQQTTKGIWMCRTPPLNPPESATPVSPHKANPLLVMDVEGTDGRERGEDQDFERKSALFSLASSEILIVNLWEHQVGLYQGANMGLLKTVFDVNLTLFGKREGATTSNRTLLLFVIRDHIGATPLANLQATLTADMLRIWESLSKPKGLEAVRLEDYFDMEFVGLPHKVLVPDQFEAAVANLRLRFTDPDNSGFLFKSAYHKRIPADGAAHYMEGIWEQVQANKDLDLPTQQELLAQFRCDEIATVAISRFLGEGGVKDVRKVVEKGDVVDGLGALMSGWKEGAMTHFDHAASRYHQEVYTRKRADLVTTIHTTLHPLYYNQLKNLGKLTLSKFKKALSAGLKGEGYDFGHVVSEARKLGLDTFELGAKEALLANAEDWGYDEEIAQLEVELQSVADVFRRDETKKIVNGIEKTFRTQISEPVDLGLNRPSKEMWDGILKGFEELLNKSETSYIAKARAFNSTEEETATSVSTLRKRSWTALINKVKEHTADAALLAKLRTSFEDTFRYDSHGVPRVWKPEDDIDSIFKKARDATLELIPVYAKIAPSDPSALELVENKVTAESPEVDTSATLATDLDFDFPASLVLLSETKQLDITSRFRRDADAYYVEAKRSMVSSVAQIPFWMYGVLIVLGWNEAMVVLFNPLYFAFLVVCLGAAYMVIQLGLVGPLLSVGRTVFGEVQNQASSKLREHFSQPQLAAPVSAAQRNHTSTTNNDDETESKSFESHIR